MEMILEALSCGLDIELYSFLKTLQMYTILRDRGSTQ